MHVLEISKGEGKKLCDKLLAANKELTIIAREIDDIHGDIVKYPGYTRDMAEKRMKVAATRLETCVKTLRGKRK